MSDANPGSGATERRRNPELRALIDEMLERVREIHRNSSIWNADERSRAEAALEQIMSRVRGRAGSAPAPASRSAQAEEEK